MPPAFLLRDDFITDAAAPLTSPRNAEPGPGTLIVTDTGQVVSVSSAMLQIGAVRAGVGDPALWGAGIARAPGLAVVSVVSSPTTNVVLGIGFDINQAGALSIGTYLAGGTEVRALSVSGQISSTNIYAAGIKKTAVVARSVGELCFFHNGTNWILIWVDVVDIQTPLYPSMTAFGAGTAAALAIDTLRALQLPAPFNTDFGLATQRLAGARAAGDTFTHTADCVIEWTQTTLPGSGAPFEWVIFRKQDASNYWLIEVTNTGAFTLWEVVAGTFTNRISAAAVLSNGHRCVVVCDGTTIRGYTNNVLRWTYSSASNFATATAGVLQQLGTIPGSVSDIVSWPRVITGVPATILDAAVGGSGDLTATLAAATLTATGQVGPVPITGQLTATLAAATVVSTGQVRIAGQLAAQLAPATLAAAGHVPQITAQLAVVLMAATLTATNVRVAIELGTVYGQADTATIYGQQVYGEVIGI